MKCLSTRPPWARLLVLGIKPVENRSWGTDYRGPLLIHQSRTWDQDGYMWVLDQAAKLKIALSTFETILLASKAARGSGIIGMVHLDEVLGPRRRLRHCKEPSEWWRDLDQFGWYVRDALNFETAIPYRGQLGLFDVPDRVVAGALKGVS
jgi:hypothetical protein